MGREAVCKARLGRQKGEGKALLETSELIFRGDFRVKVPFSAITTLIAKGPTLTVTYKGGEQTILVPPTAPIVTFEPAAPSDVKAGAAVFVNATKNDGKITANAVVVGSDGVNPPM